MKAPGGGSDLGEGGLRSHELAMAGPEGGRAAGVCPRETLRRPRRPKAPDRIAAYRAREGGTGRPSSLCFHYAKDRVWSRSAVRAGGRTRLLDTWMGDADDASSSSKRHL